MTNKLGLSDELLADEMLNWEQDLIYAERFHRDHLFTPPQARFLADNRIGFHDLATANFEFRLSSQIADMMDEWNDKLGVRYWRTEFVR